MNNIQKGLFTLMLTGVAAGSFVGCDEDDTFDINSPSWLSERVDSIANSKNSATSDTTIIELSLTEIGAKDYTTAWWTEFSDAVGIASGKKLTFEFDNYGSGVSNWNNWNLCVANAKSRDAENYKEYLVLRSDMYGWGGKMADEGYPYDAANITSNYAEISEAAGVEQWEYFRSKMQGAHVVMEIDHVTAGYVYVTATMTATDGTVLVEKYHQTCSPADDIYAFLVCDASRLINMEAYITPATIVITESNPARMELSNTPKFLAVGDSLINDGVQAKVYFEDGTSADADNADLSFVLPDLTTPGAKSVTVIYNKTSRGNYCSPIYATYDLQVTDFGSIEVETAPGMVYYIVEGEESAPFIPAGADVYGIDSKGEKTLLDNAEVNFSAVAADGSYTVEYQGLTTSGSAAVVTGCARYGEADCTTGWWSAFAPDVQVKKGETVTRTLQVRSDNAANWHGPVVILRDAALAEYAVLRADNFGWGAGYDGNDAKTLESDWNWDLFSSSIDGSVYTISVTNNGETIDVKMTVVDGMGNSHFQNYLGLLTTTVEHVDDDDVYFGLTMEAACLLLKE